MTEIRLQPVSSANVITYTVVINAPNPDKILMPGMTANASFYVTEQKDIVMVPAKAIHFTPDPESLATYNQGIANSNRPVTGPQAPPANGEGTIDHQAGNGVHTVWIKQGATIHPP